MSTLSQQQRHNAKTELLNSFKFYTPRNVWIFCVLASFAMFFDQGNLFANVPNIREDHVINSVEDHSPDNSFNHHHHQNEPDNNSLTFYEYFSTSTTSASPQENIEKALSTTLTGVFSCIFMVGFVVGTPIAQSMLGKWGSNRLVHFGLALWSLSCLAVSCAPNYYVLVAFRFFVGFAEGWFANLLVVYVDNIAPKESKMMWLAIYYAVMPVATAVGMFAGSEIGSNFRIGHLIPGWRISFFVECPIGLILFAVSLGLPKQYNIYHQQEDEDSNDEEKAKNENKQVENSPNTNADNSTPNFSGGREGVDNNNVNSSTPTFYGATMDDSKIVKPTTTTTKSDGGHHQEFISFGTALNQLICHNLDFSLLVLGYAAYDFLVTSFSSWAVVMLVQGPYGVTASQASISLGVGMLVGGVIGTIVGGKAIDWLGGVESRNGLSKCVGFALAACVVGFPLGIAACLTETLRDFLLLFVPCVTFVTMNTAGIGIAVLNVCPKNLKPYATSMMLMVMNSFGDLPAPLFVGILSRSVFAGDCGNAGTEDECLYLRDLQRNETSSSSMTMNGVDNSTSNSKNFLESTWWWKGECKWNVASLKGEESYCASTSQVNRALLCAVVLTSVLIPLWGSVVYRKWGTTIGKNGNKSKLSSSNIAGGDENANHSGYHDVDDKKNTWIMVDDDGEEYDDEDD